MLLVTELLFSVSFATLEGVKRGARDATPTDNREVVGDLGVIQGDRAAHVRDGASEVNGGPVGQGYVLK